MMPFFSSSLPVLFVLFDVSKTFAMTSCPQTVNIERGTNVTISCQADESAHDFYWYKGKTSDRDLVGELANGIKIIPEQYIDDYDIGPSGALLILNARIFHESVYNLVTFDLHGTHEEEEVIVNITISPDLPCPLINNCPLTCDKCDILETNTSGTLVCTVEGSRPRATLRWITTSQTGVNFDRYPTKFQQRNATSDSWDSSVTLDYEITESCRGKLALQCVAEGAAHSLQPKSVDVSTDQCSAATSQTFPVDVTLPTTKSAEGFIIFVVILIVAILVVLGVVLCVIFRFRQNKQRGDAAEPLINFLRDSENVQQLVKQSSKKFCYLRPLPWADEIDIAHLYTDTLCIITEKDELSEIDSNDLRTVNNITRKSLVIFMGEHGDGRTTYLKHILHEWIHGREDTFLVIYIPLKEVNTDKTLSDFVIDDILETSQYKAEHIEAILQAEDKHCLVILDGLKDLPSKFLDQGIENKRDKRVRNKVTIGELLEKRTSWDYNNLHVWVSSREADCKSRWCPQNYVKIEMKGFSDEQLLQSVAKCCLYYNSYINNSGKEHSSNNSIYEDDKNVEQTKEVCQKVNNFLDKHSLSEDFKEMSLLVNLTVHILAAYYTSAISYLKNKRITDMRTLIRVLIDCMEARYKKKKFLPDEEDFSDLEKKLGRATSTHKQLVVKEREVWEKEIGKENLKCALEIGLLKLSRRCASDADYSGIEFCHKRIQEYLVDHC